MSQANEAELLMLELINEERTSRGLDPVTINADLNQSSEDHSRWMLDTDTFSHTGVGGSSSRERIENAGYDLEGNWRTAENIGWQSERGEEGIADDVADIHESLMNSPGHRANLLNPDLEDIGIGVEVGDFDGFEAVMITQNFGTTEAVSDVPESEGPEETPAPDVPVAEADDDNDSPAPTPEPVPVPVDASPPEDPPADDSIEDPVEPDPVAPETPVALDCDVPMRETKDAFVFFDCDWMADDRDVAIAFQGAVATPQGTQTVDSPAAFEMLLADIMQDLGVMIGCDTMEFV